MAGPWGIETCGQTGKRLLGELMERQRHILEPFPYHFAGFPASTSCAFPKDSFPAVTLLTAKWSSAQPILSSSVY